MAPVTIGLLMAMPLAAWTARRPAGQRLRRLHLLLVPEEREVPEVLMRANALAAELVDDSVTIGELLRRDAGLRRAHAAMLPQRQERRRGDVDADLAVARAKTAEAETIDEALGFMTAGQVRALLSDPDAYGELLAK
jgi:membrane glycosyltransferase